MSTNSLTVGLLATPSPSQSTSAFVDVELSVIGSVQPVLDAHAAPSLLLLSFGRIRRARPRAIGAEGPRERHQRGAT